VRAFKCVRWCLCARARACARVRAFVCACERVLPLHRQASSHMCVLGHERSDCMCMPRRLCGRCGGTAGTGGVNSSAGGAGRPRVRGCGSVRSALGVARVGRRCHVGEPHDQRAMGRAICAHVGGRRRRRHLRHRRPPRRRHPIQGRVGQHQRRCAAGLDRGGRRVHQGGTQGVLQGVLGGTHGYLGVFRGTNGYQGVLKRVLRGTNVN
jgi:hypothetical protein